MSNSTAKALNWLTPKKFKTGDKQYIGINNFSMFVEISSTANFNATAPDFVCEDLTTAQDSIVNTPKTLTMVGNVADINLEIDTTKGFGDALETALNTLTPYIPARTMSQVQKIEDFANGIENTIDQIDSLGAGVFGLINSVRDKSEKITNKEEFFNFIEKIYDNKEPITLDSLYRRYENYLITSFSYEENNDGDEGDFTISFKELRVIDIDLFRNNQILTPAEEAKKSVNKTLDGQLDSAIDKGLNRGAKLSTIASDAIKNGLF